MFKWRHEKSQHFCCDFDIVVIDNLTFNTLLTDAICVDELHSSIRYLGRLPYNERPLAQLTRPEEDQQNE